jgi:hypothetical protein
MITGKIANDMTELDVWCHQEKVSTEELLYCLVFQFLHKYNLNARQIRSDIVELRDLRKSLSAQYKKDEKRKATQKIERLSKQIEEEQKILEDEQKPIPITASADEAIKIRMGVKDDIRAEDSTESVGVSGPGTVEGMAEQS